MKNKTVFITGGSGYIGTEVVALLIERGFTPIIYDLEAPQRTSRCVYIKGDVRNAPVLAQAMGKYSPGTVVHLAAKTSASRSDNQERLYTAVNVFGGLNVLAAMRGVGCRRIVFSSSAAVYTDQNDPVDEGSLVAPVSVYGKNKAAFEKELMRQVDTSGFEVRILRLFNVAGSTQASKEYLLESDRQTLLLNALRVAARKKKRLVVFGDDFATRDGTAIRDYVHVQDVADAVLAATIKQGARPAIVNIGSGKGVSNLEAVHLIEKMTQKKIPVSFFSRRINEKSCSIARISLAQQIFSWNPRRSTVTQIIQSYINAYGI